MKLHSSEILQLIHIPNINVMNSIYFQTEFLRTNGRKWALGEESAKRSKRL